MPQVSSRSADHLSPYRELAEDIRTILRYSAEALKKDRIPLYLTSVLKLTAFVMGLATVSLTALTLDRGIMAGDAGAFFFFAMCGFAVFVLMNLCQYVASVITEKIKAGFSRSLTANFTSKVFALSYLDIKKLNSAENAFLLDYDHQAIEELVFDEFPRTVSLLKVPVVLVLACVISPLLTFIGMGSLPFVVLHAVWASKKRKRYHLRALFSSGRHYACLNDALANIKMVKTFCKEDWAVERVLAWFRRKMGWDLRLALFSFKAHYLSSVSLQFFTVLFFLAGGYMVISGRMSFGSFSAISMYAALVVSETGTVADLAQHLNEERASITRGADFIRGVSKFPGNVTGAEPDRLAATGHAGGLSVEFNDVRFGYFSERPVLKGVSFVAHSGKWTLIRGKSGEGKTTLACILLRLFVPWSGKVKVGGMDIRDMDRSIFVRDLSAVHQEPYLLDDTIINNILLGDRAAETHLKKAAFCSKVDELVKGLPLGYNTRVGEGGSALSAGQRQRVALARALARSPKVLMLDEATSSIDPETENLIYGAIKESFPGLTVLFVTHRNDAVKFADRILELHDGKVIEIKAAKT